MSNAFHFDGRMAEAPELRNSATKVCKFRLIRNERAGTDESGERKERVVAIPFTAFGATAEAIAKHVRKGDQLFIDARIENNRYTDSEQREHFDYNFVVTGFDFGAPGEASRAALADRAAR